MIMNEAHDPHLRRGEVRIINNGKWLTLLVASSDGLSHSPGKGILGSSHVDR